MAASLNGFGTGYIGQRDFRSDGSYITTEWIILAYLPIAPLRSHRLIRNPSQDRNLLVYMSHGYVMVETLPVDKRQLLSVYGYFLLYLVWIILTIRLMVAFQSHWPGHEQLLVVAGVLLCGSLLLLPWYLRRRAQSAAPFSETALVDTINRLIASYQPGASSTSPAVPAMPPHQPPNP